MKEHPDQQPATSSIEIIFLQATTRLMCHLLIELKIGQTSMCRCGISKMIGKYAARVPDMQEAETDVANAYISPIRAGWSCTQKNVKGLS